MIDVIAFRNALATLAAVSLALLAGWAPSARAQQQVIYIPPPFQCPPGDVQIGPAQCITPTPPAYSAVAFHRDASDVWIAAMYPDAYSAKVAAKARCDREMGGGCNTGWQGKGYIGVARGADGTVFYAIDGQKAAVNKALAEQCKIHELGCTPIGLFKSHDEFRKRPYRGDNIREPKDLASLHKKYVAAAWVSDSGYDGMVWVASGYDSSEQAQSVAMNLCRIKRNGNPACKVGAVSGNGFILFYTDGVEDGFVIEQTEARVKQALAQRCKRSKRSCTVRAMHNARESGAFEVGGK